MSTVGTPETIRQMRLAITPQPAARQPGEYSRETSQWDQAWELVRRVAIAYLVADRPELTDEAYVAASRLWREAFPDDEVPARPAGAAA